MYIYLHTYIHIYIIRTYVYVCICKHVCLYMYIYTYVYVCRHMRHIYSRPRLSNGPIRFLTFSLVSRITRRPTMNVSTVMNGMVSSRITRKPTEPHLTPMMDGSLPPWSVARVSVHAHCRKRRTNYGCVSVQGTRHSRKYRVKLHYRVQQEKFTLHTTPTVSRTRECTRYTVNGIAEYTLQTTTRSP
jgi:hypothetical protein